MTLFLQLHQSRRKDHRHTVPADASRENPKTLGRICILKASATISLLPLSQRVAVSSPSDNAILLAATVLLQLIHEHHDTHQRRLLPRREQVVPPEHAVLKVRPAPEPPPTGVGSSGSGQSPCLPPRSHSSRVSAHRSWPPRSPPRTAAGNAAPFRPAEALPPPLSVPRRSGGPHH